VSAVEDLLAGLILGGLVAAALAWVAVRAARRYRKIRAAWRRARRTRVVITQQTKTKKKRRARR